MSSGLKPLGSRAPEAGDEHHEAGPSGRAWLKGTSPQTGERGKGPSPGLAGEGEGTHGHEGSKAVC